ncbi:MAG: DUF362 domain-containing protein [Candidatus Lokiarchaeota archaeon]|nr:DUF362 domain-containing protein [Candidatus Lokiarchaeota archaeon]
MSKNKTRVSIVNIEDFPTTEDAIIHAIELIESDFHFNLNSAKEILLKPNLLIGKKDACTQPGFVNGVIKYLQKKAVEMKNVFIGDSPGQFKKNATDIAKKVGIYEVCRDSRVEFKEFENEIPYHEKIEGGEKLTDYYVSKPIKDADILINLPKLKTHGEATMTGAIKNYWGIIPGGLKAKYHLLGKTPHEFGKCIADNFSWVYHNKPNRIIVYDLQKIMQGTMGPVSGKMVEWNLVMAGTDELALDTTALELGEVDPELIPHLKEAKQRELGISELDKIEIVGMTLNEAKKKTPKFKIPGKRMLKIGSYITSRIVYKVTKKIPILNKNKCIGCQECAQICPADAIEFKNSKYPEFQRKKCISCLCCSELCSQQAIETKRRGIKGLFKGY